MAHNINFAHRANALNRDPTKELNREVQKQGLTKSQFWSQRVKTEADVIKYYELYCPDYPDILARALASKFTEILIKHNQGQELTQEEKDFLIPYTGPPKKKIWDPMEDIQVETMKARIAIAEKNMSELMEEELKENTVTHRHRK